MERPDKAGGIKRGRGPEDCLSESEEEEFTPFTQSSSPPKSKKKVATKKAVVKGKGHKGAGKLSIVKGKAPAPVPSSGNSF